MASEAPVFFVAADDPLQAPLQPPKRERRFAFAVRVTWVPTVKTEEQDDPQSIPAGELVTVPPPEPLFETESCNKCHTIAGTGGQRGPDLTTVGRRLNPDELTWRIANGGNNMPAFGATLQSDELDALVAFLAQLKSGS